MLSFLKRVFLPTRFDACCIVIVAHWLTAILTITVIPVLAARSIGPSSWLQPINLVAAATWVALAASYCWRANSTQRTVLLLCSSVASLVFVHAWYWMNPGITDADLPYWVQYAGDYLEEERNILHESWLVFRYAIIATIVLLVNLVLRFAAGHAVVFCRKLLGAFKSDRTKGLIVALGALFLLAATARLHEALGFGVGEGTLSLFGFLLGTLVSVVAWLVLLFWLPYFLSATGKPVQKALSLSLVLFGAFVYCFDLPTDDQITVFVTVLIYICSVIGVGGCKSEAVQVGKSSVIKKAVFRPSLLSLATVLGLAAATAIPWMLDVGVLGVADTTIAVNTGTNPSAAELIELARTSSAVRWNSNGRVSFSYDPNIGAPLWTVKFDDAAPLDLISSLPDEKSVGVKLDGLTPGFEVELKPNHTGILILKDCTVTHSQLETLFESTSRFEIQGSFSVVNEDAPVDSNVPGSEGDPFDPGSISSISFRETDPGTVKRFLDATQCESQLSWVMFNSPITNEDWPAIERLAQSAHVHLYGGWASDFKLPEKNLSLEKVHCVNYERFAKSKADKEFIKQLYLNTDMNLYSYRLNSQNSLRGTEMLWKLWMLRGSLGSQTFDYYFTGSGQTLDAFAKKIGMAYEVDGESIRSLYFPLGTTIKELSSLTELRVLSFDTAWVSSSANANFGVAPGNAVSIDHLAPLQSLEELYFDAMFIPENLSVLAELESLKHLQIPAVVRSVTGPVGFDACKSLETITFLGVPDNQTWHEVSRLENLKKLTIVNIEFDESLTPERIAKAEKKLGVEVEFLQPSEFESIIPNEFRDYRDRFREDLRSDTTWLDEMLKE